MCNTKAQQKSHRKSQRYEIVSMEINWPKLFIKPKALYLLLWGAIAYASTLNGFSIWASVLIGIAAVLVLVSVAILLRVSRYKKHLEQFGTKASIPDDRSILTIVGVVPFNNENITCTAHVNENGVFLQRHSSVRFIHWTDVAFKKEYKHLGNLVLELSINNSKKITIPWSANANKYVVNV